MEQVAASVTWQQRKDMVCTHSGHVAPTLPERIAGRAHSTVAGQRYCVFRTLFRETKLGDGRYAATWVATSSRTDVGGRADGHRDNARCVPFSCLMTSRRMEP